MSLIGQSLPKRDVRVTSVDPSMSDMNSRRCKRRDGPNRRHRVGGLARINGMVLRGPMARKHRQFYPRIGSFISESAARPLGP